MSEDLRVKLAGRCGGLQALAGMLWRKVRGSQDAAGRKSQALPGSGRPLVEVFALCSLRGHLGRLQLQMRGHRLRPDRVVTSSAHTVSVCSRRDPRRIGSAGVFSVSGASCAVRLAVCASRGRVRFVSPCALHKSESREFGLGWRTTPRQAHTGGRVPGVPGADARAPRERFVSPGALHKSEFSVFGLTRRTTPRQARGGGRVPGVPDADARAPARAFRKAVCASQVRISRIRTRLAHIDSAGARRVPSARPGARADAGGGCRS